MIFGQFKNSETPYFLRTTQAKVKGSEKSLRKFKQVMNNLMLENQDYVLLEN